MKIAAIDIGSNSIHMVIVEVGASGAFRVVDRETEMVRLGAGTLSTGVLPADAMAKTLAILKAYRRLAAIHGVEEIRAVATSAIREASNGEEFLERIGKKVGIWPRAISGEEEARLVYLAALHSIHFGRKSVLVLDIGGGSLELALGRGHAVKLAASEKLGVLRMTERFVTSDPISAVDERRLTRHVRKTLAPFVRKVRSVGFDTVVGTSGTILALGRLAIEALNGQRPDNHHHAAVPASDLRTIGHGLAELDLRGRLKLPGLDRRRADIIVAGSIVLSSTLDLLGAKEILLCEWALREGLILDFIGKHRSTLAQAERYPDVRRRSVLQLAERCSSDGLHTRHVVRLALELFDAARRYLELTDHERAILEYAAWLHGAGHSISHAGHHKHTYYLVKNGGLRGFDPLEIEQIAIVARCHKTGPPKRKHKILASLPKPFRDSVQALSSLLSLADSLDRSHGQKVRSVRLARRSGSLVVVCTTSGPADLEMWGAQHQIDRLGKLFGLPVRIEIEGAVSRTASGRDASRKPAVRRDASRRPGAGRGASRRPAAKRAASRRPAAKRSVARG